MCGIAGILRNNAENTKRDISYLIKNLNHRGPDDYGFFINFKGNVAIGNSRLAIQDLSEKGKQPIISRCGRYIIVFNGEIYNFKEIKKNLSQVIINSDTDTEVLLNYFILKGPKILNELKGFFSFAIWDQKKKELFCARDKFGIKPFYYIYNNSEFIFCSEIKPLLKFQKTTAPNINAVNSYLTSEYYENKETTFYKNIFKLKPGHFLQYKNNKILQKSFWNFYDQYKKVHLPKNEVDLGNFIYELIDKAVKNSLISDVKIALAASGGLDSSILYHHVKKSENSTSKLISFKFDNKKYSEEKYVKIMNKNLNNNIEFFNITKSYFQNNLEKSILIHDEPFAGLPIIAYEKCFKSLKHHKIVLDGTGIDESHAGYAKYHLSNNKSFSKTQDGSEIGEIISNELSKNSRNYDHELTCKFKNKLKSSMYLDLFYIKIPRALRFRDKLSMANSIELRPSFLDSELICSLFKLKNKQHFNCGFGKWFLRKKYEKILGKNLVYRQKQQVQTPQNEWFRQNNNFFYNKIINNSILWETNWIDKKKFLHLYNLFLNNKFNNSFFIWKFINLHFWYKNNF